MTFIDAWLLILLLDEEILMLSFLGMNCVNCQLMFFICVEYM